MAVACVQGAEAIRVLFVGNSYLFYNDLRAMLCAMGKKRGLSFECAVCAYGSASLQSHWQGEAKQTLENERFDYVVLQDQSETPSLRPEQTIRYGTEFCRLARERGCRPVFLVTWARLARSGDQFALYGDMQRRLTSAYSRAAIEGGALAAPAGEAWKRAYAALPGLRLHLRDGSHPNAEGSYLAACVLFRTLTGSPSLGLPGTLSDAGIGRGRRWLCRIPSERARRLQQVADKTVDSFSPEKFLRQEEEWKASLPDPGGVAAQIRAGMTARELDRLAGTPFMVDGENRNRQYLLRGGAEISALFDGKGKLLRALLVSPSDGKTTMLGEKALPGRQPEQGG